MKFGPEILTASLTQVLKLIENGTLKPHVSRLYDFNQSLEALDNLKTRKSIGKLIVRGPKPLSQAN